MKKQIVLIVGLISLGTNAMDINFDVKEKSESLQNIQEEKQPSAFIYKKKKQKNKPLFTAENIHKFHSITPALQRLKIVQLENELNDVKAQHAMLDEQEQQLTEHLALIENGLKARENKITQKDDEKKMLIQRIEKQKKIIKEMKEEINTVNFWNEYKKIDKN